MISSQEVGPPPTSHVCAAHTDGTVVVVVVTGAAQEQLVQSQLVGSASRDEQVYNVGLAAIMLSQDVGPSPTSHVSVVHVCAPAYPQSKARNTTTRQHIMSEMRWGLQRRAIGVIDHFLDKKKYQSKESSIQWRK